MTRLLTGLNIDRYKPLVVVAAENDACVVEEAVRNADTKLVAARQREMGAHDNAEREAAHTCVQSLTALHETTTQLADARRKLAGLAQEKVAIAQEIAELTEGGSPEEAKDAAKAEHPDDDPPLTWTVVGRRSWPL